MTDSPSSQPFYTRPLYRRLSAAFGLFLSGVGIYAALFGYTSLLLRIVLGALLVLIGGNMVLSAYRARESWLSRLGPLP